MLKDAFNLLLNFHSRTITYKRPGTPDISGQCKISLSRFGRNLEQEPGTVVHGYEFVLSKEQLSLVTGLSPIFPSRGDRIIDSEFGNLTVEGITPMSAEGGLIVGWRIRTV